MNVLVLHRGPIANTPYDRWLADHDGDILLLASREQLDRVGEELPTVGGRYRVVEAIDDYDVSGAVEARALELTQEHGVGYVLACQERDLERAAQLREVLGLPGQRLNSAEAFRDKVLMKELVRAAGVPVAPYAEVECATDVLTFVRVQGLPVVVKPRNGGGSVGLGIIQTESELDALLAGGLGLEPSLLPNLLVEAFVPGSMCHVDGLVVGGRVVCAWPSRYLYSLASFRNDRGGRLDVTLDPADPMVGRLLGFTDLVLDALPCPCDFAFHAEVFHTPDDRLVLCEIACRTGGATIRDIQHTLFGLDLTESWVRAQLGLPLPVAAGPGRLYPARMAGQLVLMKRPGRVVAVPGEPSFPWVERYRVFAQPGQVMGEATFSGDFLASMVVSAPSRAISERRLRELEAWFMAGISIEEVT